MRRFQNNPTTTIITEKEAQLNSLIKDSESAVDMITTTINRLANVNERISTTRKRSKPIGLNLSALTGL